MEVRFGLQRHFLLKREFDIINVSEFSITNLYQIFEAAIVELEQQGFGRVNHHSPISKKDLEKIQSSYKPTAPDPKSLQQGVWFTKSCSTSVAAAEKIAESSRKNRSPCRLTQLGNAKISAVRSLADICFLHVLIRLIRCIIVSVCPLVF